MIPLFFERKRESIENGKFLNHLWYHLEVKLFQYLKNVKVRKHGARHSYP